MVDVTKQFETISMSSLHFIISAAVVLGGLFLPATEGGTCWARYNPLTGKCDNLVRLKVTREECCRRDGLSYKDEDMSTEEIFRSIITNNGVSNCLPCFSIGRDVCTNMTCNRDEGCVAQNGQPRCKCKPDCSDVSFDTPVCGTDGATYNDECQFKMRRCRTRTDVELAYYGKCQDSCDSVDCINGTCLEDETGRPHCVSCSEECSEDEVQESVCGLDGNTYESDCHLRLASCENGYFISKNHSGSCVGSTDCLSHLCMNGNVCVMGTKPHCTSCPRENCDRFPLMVLCGSDDVTYRNLCSMKKVICDFSVYIKRKHFGPCAGDMANVAALDEEAYFRYYLSLFHREQVSEPASTASVRRTTTDSSPGEKVNTQRVRSQKENEIERRPPVDDVENVSRTKETELGDEAGGQGGVVDEGMDGHDVDM